MNSKNPKLTTPLYCDYEQMEELNEVRLSLPRCRRSFPLSVSIKTKTCNREQEFSSSFSSYFGVQFFEEKMLGFCFSSWIRVKVMVINLLEQVTTTVSLLKSKND
ncbi:hypothetical protein Dsin_012579 [Dipteronia sinensis]|uniref:Uncharacterized protein n=1 Tax=Dipteronia sinensis TaxID=43782 RepID=A0AAE0AJI5_9ROSI|nr:hypothetical protein Dsin_012579 [Dipteronia sinensis]